MDVRNSNPSSRLLFFLCSSCVFITSCLRFSPYFGVLLLFFGMIYDMFSFSFPFSFQNIYIICMYIVVRRVMICPSCVTS